jgi:hypothetical protein
MGKTSLTDTNIYVVYRKADLVALWKNHPNMKDGMCSRCGETVIYLESELEPGMVLVCFRCAR